MGWGSDLEDYFAAKAATYDDVGNEPYWRFSDALLWRHILGNFSARDNDGFRFLDAGGGTGRWTIKLLAHFSRAEGLIVDMSEHMLTVARASLVRNNLHGRATVLRADLDTDWSVGEDSYKLIICFHNVLGFVADPIAVIRNLAGRLNADGVLLLVVPNWYHAAYYSILRGAMSEVQRLRLTDRVHFSRGPSMLTFDPVKFGRELNDCGLQARTLGFPTTIYPAPSATFARANEAVARLLSDEEAYDELLEMEWQLSLQPELACRGNNLLIAVRV